MPAALVSIRGKAVALGQVGLGEAQARGDSTAGETWGLLSGLHGHRGAVWELAGCALALAAVNRIELLEVMELLRAEVPVGVVGWRMLW